VSVSHDSRFVVIVGPTASGKSELAARLARRFGGEVISVDSRQIYRGLAIGSAAVPVRPDARRGGFWYRGVRHHFIGEFPPRRAISAGEFAALAHARMAEIRTRGRIPMLVGGSGFWLDAAASGIVLPAVPPNPKLRRALEKRLAAELFRMLKRLDPRRAKTIDRQNPRRLIRAIEIATALGRVPPLERRADSDALWLGIRVGPSVLEQRIARRARAMVRHGLLNETRRLLQRVGRKRLLEFGFEYRLALDCLEGKLPRAALADAITRSTKDYARRQSQWFRTREQIRWIRTDTEAERAVAQWLGLSARRN